MKNPEMKIPVKSKGDKDESKSNITKFYDAAVNIQYKHFWKECDGRKED